MWNSSKQWKHKNNICFKHIIIIIIANFYMRFSHEAQSAYSVLLPRSLDTFQCRTYSAQFPLPREHSLPGIATYNGAGKFKHNNLSPPTGPHLYTWVESSNVDKLPCWRTKVPRRMVRFEPRALSVRVEWILHYTTTRPPVIKNIFRNHKVER